MMVRKMSNTFITIAGLCILLIFAFPLIAGIFNLGNLFGMCVGSAVMLFGIYFARIIELIKGLCENKFARIILIAILIFAIVFSILFTGTLISVIKESGNTANSETTVVTLGCRVRGDIPSLQLQARCRETAKYLEENPDAVAILSGGQGPDENISEAECMFGLITDYGIDKSRLFIENQSTSTDENILFSKKIIEDNGLDNNIVIVTSEYHLKRAKLICRKNGLSANGIPANSSFYSLPTFYTREVFGLWVQYLKN